MSKQVQGLLKKISAKTGSKNGRAWTAYSLAVDAGDGDKWYRYGFEAPKVSEGSYIKFEAEELDGGILKIAGDITLDKNPSAGAKQAGTKSESTQDSIVRQSSYRTASFVVDAMLRNGAIILPKAKGKAYDAYFQYLEDATNRIFISCRIAPSVDDLMDAGVVVGDDVDDGDDWPEDGTE